VWDRRHEVSAELTGQPTREREERWRADLLDVAVLSADLAVRSDPATRRAALATLAQAEELFGTSGALELERSRHARAVGIESTTEPPPARSAWEHVLVGRSYLAAGDDQRAAAAFDRALAREPGALWANYYRGLVCLRLGRPTEAVAAFSACAALAPGVAWCVYNRGLAYSKADQPGPARADFDRAIALDPSLAAAYLGRAAVHHKAGRPADALADLRRAADVGARPADVLYRTAVISLAMNDRAAAVESLRRCQEAEPGHGDAEQLLARLAAAR
jgi:tetratricopeptide (TPR) repeat protein